MSIGYFEPPGSVELPARLMLRLRRCSSLMHTDRYRSWGRVWLRSCCEHISGDFEAQENTSCLRCAYQGSYLPLYDAITLLQADSMRTDDHATIGALLFAVLTPAMFWKRATTIHCMSSSSRNPIVRELSL